MLIFELYIKYAIVFVFSFVLRLAVQTDGVVVTNDNLRDHYRNKPEWRDVIENR